MAPPATCQVAVWPRSPGPVQLYYYFRLLYSSVMSAMFDTRHPPWPEIQSYRARHIRYHKFRYISDTRGIGWPRNGWHSWRLSTLALTNWISVDYKFQNVISESNKAAIDRQKWLVYHLADTECRFVNISIFISISEYSHHGEISKLNVNVCNSIF